MRIIVTLVVNLYMLGMLIFLILGCNREHAFDCIKSTGEVIKEAKLLEPFHYVILEDNIDLVLTNGPEMQASVESGKNLISKIVLQNQGDTLLITNDNTCNWVRNFKHHITVTLSIPKDGISLIHRGYGELKSLDALHVKTLTVYSLDAGGNIDLQLNSGTVVAYSNSHSFIKLTGQANSLDVWMNKGIGSIFAENLSADTCYVKHEGSNEIRIFPVQAGNIEILASGNVVYYNEPHTMTSSIKGTGKLMKSN
jgi:hypothetical protein